mgnify:CR=1 FL=1
MDTTSWEAARDPQSGCLFQALPALFRRRLPLRLAGTGVPIGGLHVRVHEIRRASMASVDQSTSRPGAAVRTEGCDRGQPRLDHQPFDHDGALDGHRRDMKAYARERFLWKHVAKRWEDHFLGKVV